MFIVSPLLFNTFVGKNRNRFVTYENRGWFTKDVHAWSKNVVRFELVQRDR
jgi:hypothetical protein